MTNVIEQFRSTMRATSIEPPEEIIADGRLGRFYIEGDRRGTRNGWYVLHLDGVPAGAFGSWKLGQTHTWCAKSEVRLTEAERVVFKQHTEEAKKARDQAQAEAWARARRKAAYLWSKARPELGDHPYLQAKGVQSHGLRRLGDRLVPLPRNSYTPQDVKGLPA